MSIVFFRMGLWVIFAVLALYVVRETYLGEMLTFLNYQLLNRLGLVGFGAIAVGVVAWMYEKIKPKPKSHCKVCKRPVAKGEFYCRIHLLELIDSQRDSAAPSKTRGA